MTAKHKIRMLMYNRPDFFLPLSSFTVDGKTDLVSDKTGHEALSGEMLKTADEFLTVVYQCWCGMTEACTKYIFPGDYELKPEHLYMNEGMQKIRCEFVASKRPAAGLDVMAECVEATIGLMDGLIALSKASLSPAAEDVKKILTACGGDVRRTGRKMAKLRRSVWMMGGGDLNRGLDL